jgi:hypothetical protein
MDSVAADSTACPWSFWSLMRGFPKDSGGRYHSGGPRGWSATARAWGVDPSFVATGVSRASGTGVGSM